MTQKTDSFESKDVLPLTTAILDKFEMPTGVTVHHKVEVEKEGEDAPDVKAFTYLGVGTLLAVNGVRSTDETKYHFYVKA